MERAVLFFQSAQNHEVLNEIRWFGADASAKDPRFISDPLALEFSTSTSFTTVVVASGQNDKSAHVDESVAAILGTLLLHMQAPHMMQYGFWALQWRQLIAPMLIP